MARSLQKRRAREGLGSDDFSGRLVTTLDPASTASEAYRGLRTSLFYAVVDTPPKVIVVTSPRHMEGKSTTCANLGIALAQADKKTLVMDCDLRRPTMHKIFSIRNLHGVVNVVAGEYELPEVWHEPLAGLKVATTGPLPPNPVELLDSERFAELVDRMRQTFDYVLIDAPPTELVSDPAIVAAKGDGALLVVDAQNTRKGSVRRAVRTLETVGAKVIGTVMNNVKVSGSKYSYGDYKHGY
jgi:capsular exopolysaccharide synthesis family protein